MLRQESNDSFVTTATQTEPEESRMIEVHEFVKTGQIDPEARFQSFAELLCIFVLDVPELVAVAVLVTFAAGCTQKPAPTMDAEHYLAQFMDTTVSARTDFFHYAVGGWLKRNPIPATERSWGIGQVVQEETYHRLVGINEETSKSPGAPGGNAQKIGDFWYAAMDSDANAKQGFVPLADEFAGIAAIKDTPGLIRTKQP